MEPKPDGEVAAADGRRKARSKKGGGTSLDAALAQERSRETRERRSKQGGAQVPTMSTPTRTAEPVPTPSVRTDTNTTSQGDDDDGGYEDDFEDYDDDFEDEEGEEHEDEEAGAAPKPVAPSARQSKSKATSGGGRSGTTGAAKSVQDRKQRAVLEAVSVVVSSSRVESDRDPSSASADQRHRSQLAARRVRAVKKAIVLSTERFTLFLQGQQDLYDVYMRHLRNSTNGRIRQVTTQTNEDARSLGVQTDAVRRQNQEMQFYLTDDTAFANALRARTKGDQDSGSGSNKRGGGRGRSGRSGRSQSSSSSTQPPAASTTELPLRMFKFLQNASQLMETLLEERVSAEDVDDARRQVARGHIRLADPAGEWQRLGSDEETDANLILEGRPLLSLRFSELQPHRLITVHAPGPMEVERELVGRGLFCVWDVTMPARPIQMLLAEGVPTCVAPSSSQTHVIFAGTEEGAVHVWDMREPVSRHWKRVTAPKAELDDTNADGSGAGRSGETKDGEGDDVGLEVHCGLRLPSCSMFTRVDAESATSHLGGRNEFMLAGLDHRGSANTGGAGFGTAGAGGHVTRHHTGALGTNTCGHVAPIVDIEPVHKRWTAHMQSSQFVSVDESAVVAVWDVVDAEDSRRGATSLDHHARRGASAAGGGGGGVLDVAELLRDDVHAQDLSAPQFEQMNVGRKLEIVRLRVIQGVGLASEPPTLLGQAQRDDMSKLGGNGSGSARSASSVLAALPGVSAFSCSHPGFRCLALSDHDPNLILLALGDGCVHRLSRFGQAAHPRKFQPSASGLAAAPITSISVSPLLADVFAVARSSGHVDIYKLNIPTPIVSWTVDLYSASSTLTNPTMPSSASGGKLVSVRWSARRPTVLWAAAGGSVVHGFDFSTEIGQLVPQASEPLNVSKDITFSSSDKQELLATAFSPPRPGSHVLYMAVAGIVAEEQLLRGLSGSQRQDAEEPLFDVRVRPMWPGLVVEQEGSRNEGDAAQKAQDALASAVPPSRIAW